jgi:hypothetical protein
MLANPRSNENPLHMLELCRRHHPAMAATAELQGTLAAGDAAADVFGHIRRCAESYHTAVVLCAARQVPDRLRSVCKRPQRG